MTLAIHTRFHPATDTRGARIGATCVRMGRIERFSIGYPHELTGVDAHAAAAKAIIASKLQFARDWPDSSLRYCGETLDGKGYVFSVGASLEA